MWHWEREVIVAGVALGGWRCVQVGLRAQMRWEWEWEWEWEGPEGGCGNQGDCSGNGFISAAGGGAGWQGGAQLAQGGRCATAPLRAGCHQCQGAAWLLAR